MYGGEGKLVSYGLVKDIMSGRSLRAYKVLLSLKFQNGHYAITSHTHTQPNLCVDVDQKKAFASFSLSSSL